MLKELGVKIGLVKKLETNASEQIDEMPPTRLGVVLDPTQNGLADLILAAHVQFQIRGKQANVVIREPKKLVLFRDVDKFLLDVDEGFRDESGAVEILRVGPDAETVAGVEMMSEIVAARVLDVC